MTDNPVPSELAEIIALAMAHRIPIKTLRERAGVSRSTWHRGITGRCDPSTPTLRRLREALKELANNE